VGTEAFWVRADDLSGRVANFAARLQIDALDGVAFFLIATLVLCLVILLLGYAPYYWL